MRRRRRATKEVAFSFDSFLDLVANVVGIILRLILVAWMGARTYKAVLPTTPSPPPPAMAQLEPLPEPTDPRLDQLVERRKGLRRQRESATRLDAEELAAAEVARQLQRDLEALTARENQVRTEASTIRQTSHARLESLADMGLDELRRRGKKLEAEVDELSKKPVARKELRYRTPISAPVTEEVMFECKAGRVSL